MIFIKILFLTILQSASFTLVSRARNSKSIYYHAFGTMVSNLVYILVLRNLVADLDKTEVVIGYVIGSMIGSLLMHHISMKYIEKRIEKNEEKSNNIV